MHEYRRAAEPLRAAIKNEPSRLRRLRLRWKLGRIRRHTLGGLTANWFRSALPGAHPIIATGESSGLQAQGSFTVRTDWTKYQFDLANTGLNPYENVLSPASFGGLTLAWSAPTVGDVESSHNPLLAGAGLHGSVHAANATVPQAASNGADQVWPVMKMLV